ncbi:type II secretion system F family protein [Actinacidiphila sp. ITFR-21]|uniref:type II secretion system F family protein n=1 Tax=Actinacidiphila sp. ITFR-21 TaxID=3075199 RepID=UPI00288B8C5A|nr:type II secretion system F family protein [Streptomyces sp. ITFR-21]WNI16952.1 type II secretion system F family protein [Streptomyces sp. ITFR-21]
MRGGTGWAVHSLGTAGAVLAALAAGLLAAGGARQRVVGIRRLRSVLGTPCRTRRPAETLRRLRGPLTGWGPVVAAGLGVGALIGGPLGVLAGIGTAAGTGRWLKRRQKAAGRLAGAAEAGDADLPFCADLMAACLAAGATPGEAAGAVGRCLDGPLGEALIRVRAELRLGAEPAECWDRFGRLPAAREMGRCLARAATTGSAPVAEMARLAAECRAARARTALARARRAAVLATAPLGACFLPAFLLVGVAPVVMGLAGRVLGGGAD